MGGVGVVGVGARVSRRTGLVEKLDDRLAWNQWLPAPSEGDALLAPGTYAFMYRSYVNFDEKAR